MCSSSKIDEMLRATQATDTPPGVSAMKLKHDRDKYFLVDIREPDEIISDPLPSDPLPGAIAIKADAEVPMGRIFHLAGTGELDEWKSKKVLLICNSGRRATLAASELKSNGFNAAAVTRGVIGLRNPAATLPDFIVVLGTKSNPEKVTLAINACAVAAAAGETTTLVLLGDGVSTFLRKGNNKEETSSTSFRVEEIFVGEPFKPCKDLLNKFLGTGNGLVLGCTSCVKKRGFEFGSDLIDCVKPMQMPDLLRMLGEAKKNLQFM